MIILFWISCSFLVAYIAETRGRDFLSWLLLSLSISPIGGLIVLYILPNLIEDNLYDKGLNKKCPYCAEYIKLEAIVCKHCNREIHETISNHKDDSEIIELIKKLKK